MYIIRLITGLTIILGTIRQRIGHLRGLEVTGEHMGVMRSAAESSYRNNHDH